MAPTQLKPLARHKIESRELNVKFLGEKKPMHEIKVVGCGKKGVVWFISLFVSFLPNISSFIHWIILSSPPPWATHHKKLERETIMDMCVESFGISHFLPPSN
jgi:hypothetical protein